VLKAANTTVKLEETRFTPNSIDGTLVIDWYGQQIVGYKVIQPDKITVIQSLRYQHNTYTDTANNNSTIANTYADTANNNSTITDTYTDTGSNADAKCNSVGSWRRWRRPPGGGGGAVNPSASPTPTPTSKPTPTATKNRSQRK